MQDESQAGQATPHITQMQDHLMQTLASLRDRTNPMEPDRARAIAQVASVLVDSAKAEIDYIKVTTTEKSNFLGAPPPGLAVARVEHTPAPILTRTGTVTQPAPGVTQHRLRD